MKLIKTSLPDVLLFEPTVFGDARGFFLESYRESVMRELGLTAHFVQDNHSRSKQGVLRGLHYQLVQPQGKLVRVASGAVFDVAVDIRRGSPTFGQWFGAVLTDDNHRLLYVPPNFAHGFCVLSDSADFIYKCTDYYHAPSDRGILWNDPEIGIEWPLNIPPLLSEKDQKHPALKDQQDLPNYLPPV